MPPFRIPFTKRPAVTQGVETINDENIRPSSNGGVTSSPYKERPSLALGIKSHQGVPNEFKMSAVNDSGEYLPPSPPEEKKGFWLKSPHSTSSSNHRSIISEHEPFSISRESFESYRRSFDVSGRSPVALLSDSFPSRTSLESRSSRFPPRSSMNGSTFERPSVTTEEGFEDVGLHDEPKPKKRTFLSRFQPEASNDSPINPVTEPKASSHHFHLPGRKRGQSGTGSELGSMERPGTPKSKTESVTVIR